MWRRKRVSFFPELITNPSTVRLGGGLYSSPRERELRETTELYDRVKRIFDASPYSKSDGAEMLAYDLVVEAARRAGGHATIALGEPLYRLAYDLTYDDGLLCGWPQNPPSGKMTIDEGVALRRYLRRKERFLTDHERLAGIWREAVIHILEGLIAHLPETLLVEDEAAVAAAVADAPFSVPLIDLCSDSALAIEEVIGALVDNEIGRNGLFEPLVERFEDNVLAESGLTRETAQTSTKRLVFPTQAKGKTPAELVTSYCSGTAFASLFDAKLPFAIPFPARFEHTHIVGGSGHGKTQLMQAMIYEDLQQAFDDGRSIVVIDSQGDLINTIAHLGCFSPFAERSLADRFMLIDPADISYPVCLNLFDWGDRDQPASAVERERQLNSAISLYEYIFGALLGAELTQKQGVIFKYLARLMLEIPDATIHTLGALMEDGERFRPYMDRLSGSARQFFTTRFFDRSFNETKKQILTRLWGVLSNGTLERIFGNPQSKVDLSEAINSGKIVLINTAKDFLTGDGCTLFGRFFVALVAQAAVQRASMPAHERRPCFVYIDEAADYFDDTIDLLLNQARKYKVGLVLAHQNLDQLSTGLRGSLMASTSIKFAGGVSGKDARALAEEMHCKPDFLQDMRKRRVETDFACFIRHFTPQAVSTTVPLGWVEDMPKLFADEYQELLQRNRVRYCVPLEELLAGQAPVAAVPLIHVESPEVDRHHAPSLHPPRQPIEPPAVGERTAPPREPFGPKPESGGKSGRAKDVPPPPLGRGGKQHQYLQQFIKGLAETSGWRAVIEEPVLDGTGRVDVALSRGERRIAFEISINSTRGQELGNVEKCLAAGFAEIGVVATTDRQRRMLQKYIAGALEEADRDKVHFLLPEEIPSHLGEADAATEETLIRGYRVKVKRQAVDSAEAEAKREAIAAVIARSLNKS